MARDSDSNVFTRGLETFLFAEFEAIFHILNGEYTALNEKRKSIHTKYETKITTIEL